MKTRAEALAVLAAVAETLNGFDGYSASVRGAHLVVNGSPRAMVGPSGGVVAMGTCDAPAATFARSEDAPRVAALVIERTPARRAA